MKIRILSDLHIDINKLQFGFEDKLDDCDLTIIAGDIASGWQKEKEYLTNLKHKNKIVCIAGNHLGYDFPFVYPEELNYMYTRNYCISELTKLDCVNYLENSYIEFDNYIIFGGTMFTNMSLYRPKRLCESVAWRWLNDFRYVHIEDKTIRKLQPYDYEKYFKKFKKSLQQCIDNTDKDIIAVSHHAPSPKSISKKYLRRGSMYEPGKYLNAAYCSNLESFIKKNPRIKLWIHGHMHECFDYMVGQCKVICNPFGYYHESEITPEQYEGKIINIQ